MSRPKGSKNKSSSKILVSKDQKPEVKTDRQIKCSSHYVPYEKSKIDKTGQVVTYQTYKLNNEWLIDIFVNDKISLSGYSENIGHLPDAARFIDNELSMI
jgi:hypothetical protein